MSDNIKKNISVGSVSVMIFLSLVTIIMGLYHTLRSSDVEASVQRDNQLDVRITKVETMQSDITELKVGQGEIMTVLGIKHKISK